MTFRFWLEQWLNRGTIYQDGEEQSVGMGQWKVQSLTCWPETCLRLSHGAPKEIV